MGQCLFQIPHRQNQLICQLPNLRCHISIQNVVQRLPRDEELRVDKLAPDYRDRNIARIMPIELLHYRLVTKQLIPTTRLPAAIVHSIHCCFHYISKN